MHTKNTNRGFVALMSVIVISAILLVFVFTLGVASFFNRFDTLDTESRRVSLALAEACGNMAMLKIAQDAAYTPASGGECVSVSDTCGASGATRTCRICSVALSGSEYTVLARAVYGSAYSNLRIKGSMSSTNFSVSEWTEQSAYGGPTCTLL